MNNAQLNTINTSEIKTEGKRMQVCSLTLEMKNVNTVNTHSTELTIPLQASHNSINALQRNTVSSASSLESSASNVTSLIKSPPIEPTPAPMVAPIPAQHAIESTTTASNTTSVNNNKHVFSRPLNMPISTPLSLIDSLKLKYPPSGRIDNSGTVSNYPNITGIPSVSNYPEVADSPVVGNTNVPEFLYQLIKMLTDNHREVIEWSHGKIEVHNPHKLESDVLNKYFRHSKYASFQRQLNYFGFRKLAGKGKMAPCSYVNELATSDLRSLLKMKRKTSATTRDTKNDEPSTSEPRTKATQCIPIDRSHISTSTVHGANNTALSFFDKKRSTPCTAEVDRGPRNVAKFAVGKGIRHSLNGYLKTSPSLTSNSSVGINSTKNNTLIPNPIIVPTTTTALQDGTTSSTPKPLSNKGWVSQTSSSASLSLDPHSIAQSVVGKGIRHQFATHPFQETQGMMAPLNVSASSLPQESSADQQVIESTKTSPTCTTQKQNQSSFLFLDPQQLGMGVENSLNELQNNFRNSLNDNRQPGQNINNGNGAMERVSSLVNLAIIPDLDPIQPAPLSDRNIPAKKPETSMTFIDFPLLGDYDSSRFNSNDKDEKLDLK